MVIDYTIEYISTDNSKISLKVRSLFILPSQYHTCWLNCHILFLRWVTIDQSPPNRAAILFFDVIVGKAHTCPGYTLKFVSPNTFLQRGEWSWRIQDDSCWQQQHSACLVVWYRPEGVASYCHGDVNVFVARAGCHSTSLTKPLLPWRFRHIKSLAITLRV